MVVGSSPSRLSLLIVAPMVALILALIGLMLLSFAVGGYAFYSGGPGTKGPDFVIDQLPIFFLGLPFLVPAQISAGNLFFALWTLYLLLFVVALRGPSISLLQAIKRLQEEGFGALFRNTILAVALTFSALVVTLEVIRAVGIETGPPPGDFTGYTYAPLVEEVGYRMSIIGLVAALITFGRGPGINALKVLWHPAKYMLLSNRDRQLINLTIIVSAVSFGLAHVLGGWKVGKFFEATLVGYFLGLLYVSYGFPSAVLLHWSFNYFVGSYFFFTEITGERLLLAFTELVVFSVGIMTLLALALGLWRGSFKGPFRLPTVSKPIEINLMLIKRESKALWLSIRLPWVSLGELVSTLCLKRQKS